MRVKSQLDDGIRQSLTQEREITSIGSSSHSQIVRSAK
jgi:hypothetical protein